MKQIRSSLIRLFHYEQSFRGYKCLEKKNLHILIHWRIRFDFYISTSLWKSHNSFSLYSSMILVEWSNNRPCTFWVYQTIARKNIRPGDRSFTPKRGWWGWGDRVGREMIRGQIMINAANITHLFSVASMRIAQRHCIFCLFNRRKLNHAICTVALFLKWAIFLYAVCSVTLL